MPYGTLSMADLKATTTQSVVQMGPGYERAIYEVFENSLAAHKRVTDNLISTFVDRTTDRLVGVGGVQTMKMDDLDEFGTAHSQKVAPGENMGFPLRLTGVTLQWTLTYFQRATPADVANQLTAAADADKLRLIRDVKRALYTPTNSTFVDVRMKDQASIAVKALANADSMSVPVGPNGETFTASSHTHYAGTASFVAGDLTTLVTNVAEHYEANDIVLAINAAQEATVRAFTGFVATVDARIVQPQTATYVSSPPLNMFQYNNREIGIFGGATVVVRPWTVPGYVAAYNRLAPKVLAYREYSPGSGDFALAFEDEDHPLRAKGFQREFGIAPRNRWGAAILDTAHSSYTAPTIT